MTIPFQCLAGIVFLPYLWAAVGGYLITRQETLDNKYHRVQQATLKGPPARAYGAHYNAMEAVPMFTAGVVTAHLFGADPSASAEASLAFVVCRVLHGIFYLADRDVLRSLAFMGAVACVGRLFWLAAAA